MDRMKLRRIPFCIVMVGLFSLLSGSVAKAQITMERLEEVRAKLQPSLSFYKKLNSQQQKMLSGASANFFHVLDNWDELEQKALQLQKTLGQKQQSAAISSAVVASGGPIQVSNPVTDFAFGPSGGFTQSETSTAWCGSRVVVGFNDSGSFYESLLASAGFNLSFNGFGLSTNQGVSYSDLGFLPSATANPINFLEGDPVVACTSERDFYYSSLFATTTSANEPLSAISVSFSTNGGTAFGSPVIAVAKDANTHGLDKDWMAVNPTNSNQIAVTYTDFDLSGTVCGAGIERVGIEIVWSNDGGNTWSAPKVVTEVCETAAMPGVFVQGSQVAFSPSGAVNVAFEYSGNGTSPGGRQIRFTRAARLGGAFGPIVMVANINGVGDGFQLQGGFRAFIDLQGMAVDRSKTASKGSIYIVWHDTDAVDSTQDFAGVPYFYSDAWISRSSNNGATWSTPVQIDTNKEPLPNGLGTDSYFPGVGVDGTSGKVGVCWYDRRNDPLNFKIDRFCGHSVDGGKSFTNFRVTTQSFLPIHGADDLVNAYYMGDYDTVTTDLLQTTGGFIGAFQVVAGEGGENLVPNSRVQANDFD